jgi:TusA-related sulfurtransferase
MAMNPGERFDHAPTAQIILDGSADTWSALTDRVLRFITELGIGQVLQVICGTPASAAEVEQWCQQTGHQLVYTEQQQSTILYWIKKAPTT